MKLFHIIDVVDDVLYLPVDADISMHLAFSKIPDKQTFNQELIGYF